MLLFWFLLSWYGAPPDERIVAYSWSEVCTTSLSALAKDGETPRVLGTGWHVHGCKKFWFGASGLQYRQAVRMRSSFVFDAEVHT